MRRVNCGSASTRNAPGLKLLQQRRRGGTAGVELDGDRHRLLIDHGVRRWLQRPAVGAERQRGLKSITDMDSVTRITKVGDKGFQHAGTLSAGSDVTFYSWDRHHAIANWALWRHLQSRKWRWLAVAPNA